jgi:nitroimidazol reductase NimA-like FMN-containing flavoprotein (pyridoxamine 5'-phosphate oxidase superfamily)
MRRKERLMPEKDTLDLLTRAEYGVLSTVDEDGQPYGVPVSFANTTEKIYFHSAQTGHKLDNIENQKQVSFCVVGDTQVLPSQFSTRFESVIVFGEASIVTDREEKLSALILLAQKYAPGFPAEGEVYIQKGFDHTAVVGIKIQHLTGKNRNK